VEGILMDDLLREFLTETSESLDTVDNQLVRFEQDPNNAKILDNILRLVSCSSSTSIASSNSRPKLHLLPDEMSRGAEK
jgi:hypothetical protein